MNAVKTLLRRRGLMCLLIGAAALASWWPRWGGPIDLRWDGGAYYILGTSLSLGEGYRILSEPGTLSSSLHPPFVPALVAAHELILQTQDPVVVGRALRVTVALFSAAYASAVFLLLSASLPRLLAVAITLVAVLQPQYVYFSDALYAEAFFGLFSVLFFVVRKYRRGTLGFVLCGVCAVLAYEARTAGVALLAAWVVDHALRKEWRRTLIALAVSAIVVTSWNGWIKAVESSPEYRHPAYAYQTEAWLYFNVSYARNLLTYFDPWWPELGPLTPGGFVRRVIPNLKVLPRTIGQAVSTWEAPERLAFPLGVLVLVGLLLQAVRREYVLVLYVGLSLTAMCATPFQKQFVRYLLPLYPLLMLALFELLAWATAQARRRWPTLPAALASAVPWSVIVLIAWGALNEVRGMYAKWHHEVAYQQHGRAVNYRLFYYGPEGVDLDAALDWLDLRAAPDDTLAAGDPQWVYLRTGRRCVLPPFELDGRKAQQLIDTVPVKYLLASVQPGAYQRFTAPLLAANPDAWRRVWRGPNGTLDVYERVAASRP
jgi:hypothetical protein